MRVSSTERSTATPMPSARPMSPPSTRLSGTFGLDGVSAGCASLTRVSRTGLVSSPFGVSIDSTAFGEARRERIRDVGRDHGARVLDGDRDERRVERARRRDGDGELARSRLEIELGDHGVHHDRRRHEVGIGRHARLAETRPLLQIGDRRAGLRRDEDGAARDVDGGARQRIRRGDADSEKCRQHDEDPALTEDADVVGELHDAFPSEAAITGAVIAERTPRLVQSDTSPFPVSRQRMTGMLRNDGHPVATRRTRTTSSSAGTS